ncbi:MAG: sulfotransferase, partial [Deltaproteobacteria bacterium]|nr:sulfotransferase [Deltaproteobacteria bacterium]
MSSQSDPGSTREVEGASESGKAPLLITGCPRTGTTALARWLSTHDKICIFNEYSLYYPPAME